MEWNALKAQPENDGIWRNVVEIVSALILLMEVMFAATVVGIILLLLSLLANQIGQSAVEDGRKTA